MRQLLFVILLTAAIAGYLYCSLTPQVAPVQAHHREAAATSTVSSPIASALPASTPSAASAESTPVPAATPFPSRSLWPAEVSLKKPGIFSQTVGGEET